MTFGIVSLVIVDRGHSEGWKHLDGHVADHIITWNQLCCGQNGMAMIMVPHFIRLLRLACYVMLFGDGEVVLSALAIPPSGIYLRCLKHQGTFNAHSLTYKSTTAGPHHLHSLQQTGTL